MAKSDPKKKVSKKPAARKKAPVSKKVVAKKSAAQKLGFFKTIAASIAGPDFYAKAQKENFWRSLWHMSRLIALVFFVVSIFSIVVPFYNNIDGWIADFSNEVDVFPEDLVISMVDNDLSINQPEPYYFSFPNDEEIAQEIAKEMPSGHQNITNFLVIDTQTPYSTKQFYEYESFVWLNENEIHFVGDGGAVQSIDWTLEGIENFSIDQAKFNEFIGEVLGLIKPIMPIVFGVAFFVALGFLILANLFKIVIVGLLTWLIGVAVFKRKKFGFPEAYITSMYAVTVSILVSGLTILLSQWVEFPNIHFQYTILALIVVSANFSQIGGSKN